MSFCKMDIRPIFFQEIGFAISWKNWPDVRLGNRVRSG
jgi:hypothetical protein